MSKLDSKIKYERVDTVPYSDDADIKFFDTITIDHIKASSYNVHGIYDEVIKYLENTEHMLLFNQLNIENYEIVYQVYNYYYVSDMGMTVVAIRVFIKFTDTDQKNIVKLARPEWYQS